jgi:DNA-directed RNA polymerase beta subunit
VDDPNAESLNALQSVAKMAQDALVKLGQEYIGARESDRRFSKLWFKGKIKAQDGEKAWAYVSVHPGLCSAAFDSLRSEGIDCKPHYDNPHISFIRKEEVAELKKKFGTKWRGAVKEGQPIRFALERIVHLIPKSWDDVDRVWFLEVDSPDLRKIRASLGLTELPTKGDQHLRFHITFAIRKSHTKAAAEMMGEIARAADPNASALSQTASPEGVKLQEVFNKMEMDPNVTMKTLGAEYARVNPAMLIRTSQKLLNINKGTETTDDRDSLAFQGPEDFFAERVAKDAGQVARKLLWRTTLKGNLDHIPSGALTPQLRGVLLNSGMAQPLEEINPFDAHDQSQRVLRLGFGGIPSEDAIPDEARNVSNSHLGFVDPIRSPESSKIGVDSRVTHRLMKGSDGRLYSPMTDVRTGKEKLVSAEEASESIIAFPGEMASDRKEVRAMVRSGKVSFVSRDQVDFALPSHTQMFSSSLNLIPMLGASKGGRALMGGKYPSQSLPMRDPEGPLVRSVDENGKPFVNILGVHMGAVRSDAPGVVEKVTADEIVVRTPEGKKSFEIAHNFPYNRKTLLHNTPVVKIGDQIAPGQLLASSNYTDAEGNMAIGKNLRAAYLPYKGLNYEDASVVSESAAQRLSSEHLYQHPLEPEEGTEIGRKQFVSLYPAQFTATQLKTVDERGVVQPGTRVKKGDPLVLAIKRTIPTKLARSNKPMYVPSAIVWDYEADGVVTDAHETKDGGYNVAVKAYMPLQEGDKLCYAADTEVLTAVGWKSVTQLALTDQIASLTSSGCLEYLRPSSLHRYPHEGTMYSLETTQVSLQVTAEHKLYAKPRNSAARGSYSLIEASKLFGKRYQLQNNAEWAGIDPEYFSLPALTVRAGQFGRGQRDLPEIRLPIKSYMALLGMFLSEGSTFARAATDKYEADYGFDISQFKPGGRTRLFEALEHIGIRHTKGKTGARARSKQWLLYFVQFGKAGQKFIPAEVFSYTKDSLRVLYDWLMWGDGHEGKTTSVYTTTSKQLADDFQRLCLHIGWAARILMTAAKRMQIKGKWYDCAARYDVFVYKYKTSPEINHGHSKKQSGQKEQWISYSGSVYCVTLPRNHVLYVRRNGKPVWCGNSGFHGDKGVVGRILPDDQMPRDAEGRPLEILLNPLGVLARNNTAQVYEALLGKVAAKTGKPIDIPSFQSGSLIDFVQKQLKDNKLSDAEDLEDPETGRKIPSVLTGMRYLMKLHHTAEAKSGGRDTGNYTAEGIPAKGGDASSKRIGTMETNAIISHGATEVLKDAKLIRGQRNDDFWRAFRLGYPPSSPKIPFVYEKFMASLAGAGVNVKKDGNRLHLFALTDKDVGEMSAGAIKSADTVEGDDYKPVAGGLFDESLTGGAGGNRWSHIALNEPMPNPVMEEPIRRLLGMTKKDYREVIAGRRELWGKSGGAAIQTALGKISVESEMHRYEEILRNGPRSKRDDAAKALGYLKTVQDKGINMQDWVMTKWPVLPPSMRPITVMRKMQMVADPNYLYRDLFYANDDLAEIKGVVGNKAADKERLRIYDGMRAVAGLGDPIQAKTQEKNAKGLLAHVFGSSPKVGMYQRRVLNSAVDVVGRATITPNPELGMDQVGLPESKAWTIYRPFVVRNLVRRGMPSAQAAIEVANQSATARSAMVDEIGKRPVIINRAPTLHRYGFMAAWPVLVKNDTLQLPPPIVAGFNADFDGDAMNYHVPVSDEAVKDAVEKMMPSKNLHSVRDFKVHYLPRHEFMMGLYLASRAKNTNKPRTFRNKEDVIAAYQRGDIGIGDKVVTGG